MTITQDYLEECFDYNTETGVLFWKKRPLSHFGNDVRRTKISNTKFAGKQVLTIHKNGKGKEYLRLKLNGKFYLAHRIIWFMSFGCWPEFIDHINGNGMDNRLSNLRSVTVNENNRNLKANKNNTSGVTGVAKWNGSKWVAHIWENNKQINLGVYSSFEDAVSARKNAEMQMGYHPLHGMTLAEKKKAFLLNAENQQGTKK